MADSTWRIDGTIVHMPVKASPEAGSTDDGLLDAINRQLIVELQQDARLSLAELGRRVSLSSPAVAERLRRLDDAGVITGYSAMVDPRRLGYGFGAVIRIRPAPGKLAIVADLARSTPEVVECHRVTGDDCYVAIAYVRDVEHLEQVIDRFAAHGQTTSSIMQSSPVPRRPVLPQGERRRSSED
jgi:Lrp/AsnC family leucine-responsive transcriptional regulator